jgi:predicted dithiol-disulfide oxidoreductase (DUF899 family)
MMTKTQTTHPIVSPTEWLAARRELLAKEKQFTRQRDALSAERRKLPWVKAEKEYAFDAPDGKRTLAELFGTKSQLIVYHFMFGPGWEEGCPSCSFLADHFDGALVHLAHRDVSFVVISRAPLPQIESFKQRMGWRFPWVSSFGTSFNYDYHVSFTKEEKESGQAYYNFDNRGFPSDEGPGASISIKTKTEPFSILIPPMRGAWISWSERTTFLTLFPRAVTKRVWRSLCHGSVTTTNILT